MLSLFDHQLFLTIYFTRHFKNKIAFHLNYIIKKKLWLLISSKIHIKNLFMYCLYIHAFSKIYVYQKKCMYVLYIFIHILCITYIQVICQKYMQVRNICILEIYEYQQKYMHVWSRGMSEVHACFLRNISMSEYIK